VRLQGLHDRRAAPGGHSRSTGRAAAGSPEGSKAARRMEPSQQNRKIVQRAGGVGCYPSHA